MRTIRRATLDDAEPLARLAESTFRDAFAAGNRPADVDLHCARSFSATIQSREIHDPNTVTIVAELDGELIAFAQVLLQSPKPCVDAKRPSELRRFYVSEEWHGRGIAQEVLSEVLTRTARGGSDALWLGVWERNSKAMAFYRKCGFTVVGEHVFHLGEDPQRDLVMAIEMEGSSAAEQALQLEKR